LTRRLPGSKFNCSKYTPISVYSLSILHFPGTIYENNIQNEEKFTHSIHRGFFSQIVPKLPYTAARDLIVIPRESHHQTLLNSPVGFQHMHMQIASYLNQQNLVSDETVGIKTEEARAIYTQSNFIEPTLFPQAAKLQSFFGLSKEDAYRYTDKLHPTAGLRKGYTLRDHETLSDWWTRHEKNTSRFSTQLTKDLVHSIKNTDIDDSEALKKLFVETDRWLLLKANSSSSRYHQVNALRNNIFYRLMNEMGIEQSELALKNRRNLQETNYFLTHWNRLSKSASFFKTDATRDLDKAFAEHAEKTFSYDSDQELMKALNTWLDNKKESKSNRWEAVIEIKEHLTNILDSCYENTLTPQAGL
jgi:hypothetical protein